MILKIRMLKIMLSALLGHSIVLGIICVYYISKPIAEYTIEPRQDRGSKTGNLFSYEDEETKESFSKEVVNVTLSSSPSLAIKEATNKSEIEKSKLYLHPGPLKTGTTSVQVNAIASKKAQSLLSSDGFQTVPNIWRTLKKIGEICLGTEPDERDCNLWHNDVKPRFDAGYNNTLLPASSGSPKPIYTLHSSETWSTFPKNNFTFSLMEELFDPWDVSFIIFYRPFMDWLPSMYAQYRKYTIRNVGTWYGHYEPTDNVLLPEFLQQYKHDLLLYRDTLGTYQYFKDFLVYIGQQNPDQNIIIMQTYAPISVEHEFLCNLPYADNSCKAAQEGGFSGARKNGSDELPLDLDLIVRKAFEQQLISVQRRDATLALEAAMKEVNITVADLPQNCISEEEEEWIWNRTLESEEIFGMGPVNETELREKFEIVLSKNKFCVVNATATLEMEDFRGLFNNCIFQSPNLLNVRLRPQHPNPKWVELNCTNDLDL
mmetsp:Transcript_25566/g.31483  ORF Transcript_25566/g.31483 Transcript_25566/m.31483 type:complete len:487 (-) Transcript_25566:3511-4971(-)